MSYKHALEKLKQIQYENYASKKYIVLSKRHIIYLLSISEGNYTRVADGYMIDGVKIKVAQKTTKKKMLLL